MEPRKIRLSGYGGQGIVLAGVIVGQASVLDGHNAVQTQSYGSESRGGACKADVIVSDDEIFEIEAGSFDCLVAMSPAAYTKFGNSLKSGGILIVEKDVTVATDQAPHSYTFAATDAAQKHFGKSMMGNVVMLGFMSAVLHSPSAESMKEALRMNLSEGVIEANIRAFGIGYDEGSKA